MLEKERKFFEQKKEQLIADHLGKFVLIKEEDLIGSFNTIEEAVTEGASTSLVFPLFLSARLVIRLRVKLTFRL